MRDLNSKSRGIAERAQALVAAHPYFRGTSYPISFQSFEKVLVVTGRVPSFYLKQILQSEVAHLEGVDRVENQVEVNYERFGS
jgi:osmotically-inducible protein OsmY